MTEEINLLNMSDKQAKILGQFLLKSRNREWIKGEGYSIIFDNVRHEFTLSHNLYKRDRSFKHKKSQHDYDDRRYEVIAGENKKGNYKNGSYGEVRNLIATLAHYENGTMYTKIKADDKKRVVKKIGLKKNKFSSHGSTIEQVKEEAKHAKNAGQLHVKPVIALENQAYVTMRKAPGVLLSELINDSQLTIEQKRLLSEALIKTAYEILHKRGIVHLDLKPDNIYVDISVNPYVVTYLDYGKSCDKKEYGRDTVKFGTPLYQAPEADVNLWSDSDFPITVKMDAFSLGRIIAEVWGNKNHTNYSCSLGYNGKPKQSDLALNFDDSVPLLMKQLIEGLIEYKPVDRLSLEDAVKFINGNFNETIDKNKLVANSLKTKLDAYCNSRQSSLYKFFHHSQLTDVKLNLARNLIGRLDKINSIVHMEEMIIETKDKNTEQENAHGKSYNGLTASGLEKILDVALANLNKNDNSKNVANVGCCDYPDSCYMPWTM